MPSRRLREVTELVMVVAAPANDLALDERTGMGAPYREQAHARDAADHRGLSVVEAGHSAGREQRAATDHGVDALELGRIDLPAAVSALQLAGGCHDAEAELECELACRGEAERLGR